MKVTKTGIKGFDKFVKGGFPESSSILITGNPGTGKTIFGMEFLYNGAIKFGEIGLFISFEQTKESIIEQAKQFKWDFEKLEKAKKLYIMSIPATSIEKNTVERVTKMIKAYQVSRVVVDSLSTLSYNTPTIKENVTSIGNLSIKRFVYSFINKLSETKVTALLTSQNRNSDLTIDGVSEFICDGIITVKFQPMGGKYSRSLTIQKMRLCKNDEDLHPFEITNKGIVIHVLE